MATVLLIRAVSVQAMQQARQLLEKGETISLVFFYLDGVLQAFSESDWSSLAQRYALKLMVCQSGINDRQLHNEKLLLPFSAGTLADFFHYLSHAQHCLTFDA